MKQIKTSAFKLAWFRGRVRDDNTGVNVPHQEPGPAHELVPQDNDTEKGIEEQWFRKKQKPVEEIPKSSL